MIPKRTPNSKTWINLDGSYTTEVFQEVVHFKDEHGNLQNINTDLVDESNLDTVDFPVSREGKGRFNEARKKTMERKAKNTLDRDQFDYQAPFLPFELKLPKNFMRGYTIGKGSDKLTFKPVKASPSKGYTDEAQKNLIHYQDVWNDTDVTLEVTPHGVKETLYLKTDRAPVEFLFEVTGGLREELTTETMRLEPAWLIDAAGERRDVAQVLAVEGNKKFVKLSADVAGLVYPIEIDPTVSIIPDGNAGKDAYVYSNAATSNYGSSSNFEIGNQGAYMRRGYMQFDYSTIPSGAVVLEAFAELFYNGGFGTSIIDIGVSKVTSTWSETSVTWNNQPTYAAEMESIVQINRSNEKGGYKRFAVTNMVKDILKGYAPNNGFVFRLTKEGFGGPDAWALFYSSDASLVSQRPKMTINYNLKPSIPNIITPNGGENWNAEHLITWQPSTDPTDLTTHEPLDYTAYGSAGDSFGVYAGWGQAFRKAYEGKIVSIGLWISNQSGAIQDIPLKLVGIDPVTMLPNGTVYATGIGKTLANSDYQYVIYTLSTPVNVPKDTWLGIHLEGVVKTLRLGLANETVDFPPRYRVDQNGSFAKQTSYAMMFHIKYDNAKSQNELRYQVDLSVDDGATWKVLKSLTDPGATSLLYDFTNEPETSVASISIRAYDGTSYSDWDESSSVFTIQHNKAPGTPINLAPTGGLVKDRALPIRLSWLHNDPDAGDPQSKFDLQWRKKGTTAWITVTVVSANQYHDLSGLGHGEHEWRVRTYDQAGLSSPYSDIALFLAGDKPAAASIVSPVNGAAIAVANPTVQWSSDSQAAYKLTVKDAGVTVWTDEKATVNKAVTIGAALQNQKAYTVELSIKNADGLWSNLTQITINVSYTPPALPTLSAIGQSQAATIRLTIGAPLPSGTEPSVTHHDIYRRKQGESAWGRIATGAPANGSYVDATAGSGQVYDYYTRAWGNNGTYRDSQAVSSSITLLSMWLLDPLDPESLHRFHYFEPGRSADRVFQGALMEFEGRKQYMAEFSEREQNKVNVVLQLKKDSNDLEALHDLLGRRTALLYRDAKGRRIFGSIFVLTENETDYGYTVPLEVQAVDYKEEV